MIMTDGLQLEFRAIDEDDLLETVARKYPRHVIHAYYPGVTYYPRPRRLVTDGVYAIEKAPRRGADR